MSRYAAAATAVIAAVLVALLVLVQGGQLGSGSAPAVVPRAKTSAGYRIALAEANTELAHHTSTERGNRSNALLFGWIAVGLLAAAGVALAASGHGRPARTRPRAITVPSPAARASGSRVADRSSPSADAAAATGDRQVLVQTCIEVADVIPVEALRLQLVTGLRAAGVEPVAPPDGSRFDPAVARIVDREPTADPEQEHHIARTERMGYIDRGHRLRQPEVTVYSLEKVRDA